VQRAPKISYRPLPFLFRQSGGTYLFGYNGSAYTNDSLARGHKFHPAPAFIRKANGVAEIRDTPQRHGVLFSRFMTHSGRDF